MTPAFRTRPGGFRAQVSFEAGIRSLPRRYLRSSSKQRRQHQRCRSFVDLRMPFSLFAFSVCLFGGDWRRVESSGCTPRCLHFNKSKTKYWLLHFRRGRWPGRCLLGAGAFGEATPVTVQSKAIRSCDLGRLTSVRQSRLPPTPQARSYSQILVL